MSSASVTLGNNFLNMYQGIMLPSLPVSILYRTAILLLPVCVSNLAVSINQFLFMYTELILTVSISSCLYSTYTSYSISLTTLLLLLWQTFLKCPTLLPSAHILLYAGHCLGWWIPPQYLHSCHCVVWFTGTLGLSSFAFYDIFNTATWALCASTLLPMPTCLHLLCGHCF